VKPARDLQPNLRLVRADEMQSPVGLDDLYREYCRYVAAIVLRLSGNRHDFEDLLQDVFAEAASGIANLRQPEAVRGWLATISVRVVRRYLRRQKLYRFLGLVPEADYEQVADPAASPFDRSLLATVYRALDEIPVDDRLAFVLHVVQGETVDAMSRICGCSRNTIKRRILRARFALEERLSDG
jgi:RNA polymerase sigma-70 factor, ECF subfamily